MSAISWVDSHCHFSFYEKANLEPLLLQLREKGGQKWVLSGWDASDIEKQLELKSLFPLLFFTSYGLHPWRAIELSVREIDEQLLSIEKKLHLADGIGETGLDFFEPQAKLKKLEQELVFRRHLKWGRDLEKPLSLHVVRAHLPALKVLDELNFAKRADGRAWGLIHSFSGSFEIAAEYIRRGFLISLGPSILNPRFKKLRHAAAVLDHKHIVFESDSPEQIGAVKSQEGAIPIVVEVAKCFLELNSSHDSKLETLLNGAMNRTLELFK